MGTMWDSLKRGLQDGAAVVFDKAEGLTQIGRARLDVAAAKTQLSRLEGELGAETFRLVESGAGPEIADSERVRSLCGEIGTARTELHEAEAAFDKVRRDLQATETDEVDDAPLGT